MISGSGVCEGGDGGGGLLIFRNAALVVVKRRIREEESGGGVGRKPFCDWLPCAFVFVLNIFFAHAIADICAFLIYPAPYFFLQSYGMVEISAIAHPHPPSSQPASLVIAARPN